MALRLHSLHPKNLPQRDSKARVCGRCVSPGILLHSIRAKIAIWKTFLQKVPTEVKISKQEIDDLSHKEINGRQVRRSQLSEAVTVIPQLTDITV